MYIRELTTHTCRHFRASITCTLYLYTGKFVLVQSVHWCRTKISVRQCVYTCLPAQVLHKWQNATVVLYIWFYPKMGVSLRKYPNLDTIQWHGSGGNTCTPDNHCYSMELDWAKSKVDLMEEWSLWSDAMTFCDMSALLAKTPQLRRVNSEL